MLSTKALAWMLILSLAGCAKKEPPLGYRISGIRAPLGKILVSPLAFDGAIVAVEGIAKDVTTSTNDPPSVTFKLSDLKGNYINVTLKGKHTLKENDYLVVGGVYRRASNEIEARELEVYTGEKTLEEIINEQQRR
ncbi:MAG: hypothetical protein QXI19_14900 [Candidatus Caldarchaeum sp.]